MQALEDMGITAAVAAEIGLRVYKVGMPWPLEPRSTHDFAEGLEEILVVEEKRSIIEDQLTGQLYNYPVGSRPRVIGEFDEEGRDLLPNLAELTPASWCSGDCQSCRAFLPIRDNGSACALDRAKGGFAGTTAGRHRAGATLLLRLSAQHLHPCSRGQSCPGRYRLPLYGHLDARQGNPYLYPDGWRGRDLDRPGTFYRTKHVFQNLGDGTYFHSGILAIRAAVSAGVNITYKILYNDAVAMTGGQPIDGSLSVDDLIQQVRGEGVRRIALVSDDPDDGAASLRRPRLQPAPPRRAGQRAERVARIPGYFGDRLPADLCCRETPAAQKRTADRPAKAPVYQRGCLRGLWRLQLEIQLPVGATKGDRAGAQAADRPECLQ